MEKLQEMKEPSPAEGDSEDVRMPGECPLVKLYGITGIRKSAEIALKGRNWSKRGNMELVVQAKREVQEFSPKRRKIEVGVRELESEAVKRQEGV